MEKRKEEKGERERMKARKEGIERRRGRTGKKKTNVKKETGEGERKKGRVLGE